MDLVLGGGTGLKRFFRNGLVNGAVVFSSGVNYLHFSWDLPITSDMTTKNECACKEKSTHVDIG